jgi:hypothetical protein
MGVGVENAPNGSGQGPRMRDPDPGTAPSLHKVRSTRLFNQLDLGSLGSGGGGGSDSNSNHGAAKRVMADLEGDSQDSLGSGSRHSRGSNSTTGTSGTGTGTGGKPSARPGGLLGRVLSGV